MCQVLNTKSQNHVSQIKGFKLNLLLCEEHSNTIYSNTYFFHNAFSLHFSYSSIALIVLSLCQTKVFDLQL